MQLVQPKVMIRTVGKGVKNESENEKALVNTRDDNVFGRRMHGMGGRRRGA